MELALETILSLPGCDYVWKDAAPESPPIGVSTDSRTVGRDELFVALTGDRFDGHDFVDDVLARGAWGAVVSRAWLDSRATPAAGNIIACHDVLTSLQDLAAAHRSRHSSPMIAVTGTNGKTTTRALLADILATQYSVHTTRGNFNNHIGLPLTLLQMTTGHSLSVVEMGSSHFGEIHRLCEIARPTEALITNIGRGHIEFFGDLAGVLRAKRELFDFVAPDGVLYVNLDDPTLRGVRWESREVITFGQSREADIRGRFLGYGPNQFPRLRVEGAEMLVPAPGRHLVQLALAGVAVGLHHGIGMVDIGQAIEGFSPPGRRMNLECVGGVRLIDDCYNANPDSTRAALEVLAEMETVGRRIAVLGDMLELGRLAEGAHREVGKTCAQLGIDCLFTFGPHSAHTAEEAGRAGLGQSRHFTEKAELEAAVLDTIGDGDAVLIKGSRGMQMETVVAAIRERFDPGP